MGESKNTSTLPLALGHWWLTSSRQINSGKEPRFPFMKSGWALQPFRTFWRRKKFLSLPGFKPWTIKLVEQMLFWPSYTVPEFQPTTGHEGAVLAALPSGKKHYTYCTGGWVSPRAILTGAQNLVSTLGFNPQTAQPIASHYTHAMKA
jgi:hypothetical protein